MNADEGHDLELQERQRYQEELLAYIERDGGNLETAQDIAAELGIAWAEYEAVREVEMGRADLDTVRRLAKAFGVSEPKRRAA